jgi:hypothetical protein
VQCAGRADEQGVGLGLGRHVTDEELDEMELFYDERQTPIQIELCPLATPDLPSRLSTRGLSAQRFRERACVYVACECVPGPGTAR